MIKKWILFIGCFLASVLYSQHKFLNDPKLSDEDLKSTQSKIEADAPAEVLYRSVHFMIDYNGFLTQEIVSRVKIYNKDTCKNDVYVGFNGHDYQKHYINGKLVQAKKVL